VEDALLPRDEKPDEGGVVQYSGHDTMEEIAMWASQNTPPAGRDFVQRLWHRCVRFAIRFSSPAKDAWSRAFRSSCGRISVVRHLRRSDAQDGQEQDEALLKDADLGGIRSTGRNRASRKQHSKETGDGTFTP
jgi:hypothetical protein